MRTVRFSLRIDERSDELVRRAADESRVPVGQFIENAAVRAAVRVLADRTAFTLSEVQWQEFAALLDRPAGDLSGLDRVYAAWERDFGQL